MKKTTLILIIIALSLILFLVMIITTVVRNQLPDTATQSPTTVSPSILPDKPTGVNLITDAAYEFEPIDTDSALTPVPTIEGVTPHYQQTEQYNAQQEKIYLTILPTIEASNNIEPFKNSLPYETETFSIWYDSSNLEYVIQVYEETEESGIEAAEEYVRANGIDGFDPLREYKIQVVPSL